MTKKILIAIASILLIGVIGLLSYGYFLNDSRKEVMKPTDSETGITPSDDSISKEEKLEQFKRRMNFRSILRKGDFYSIKNMKETALQYYLNAYKKLPNDHVIEKKIGDTYFEMKNFSRAYLYYKKIPSSENEQAFKDKMFKALLYTGNKDMRNEFNQIKASKEIKDYYDKVLVCYTGIKNCLQEIKSYTGSVEKINNLKKDILDFEKIKNTDSNSKYAMLAGDFLKNKDFLAAALISQETLVKRPNYTSVLKIAGFSWYELGNYRKSNDQLQKYYAIEPKDVTVTYLLGVINFYLENYISSNLYFNAAVLNGYRPKTELQKRLAYNYYIIGDKKNMLKVFRYILDEEDTTQDDYAVALYTSIEEKEYSKSMLWANKGVKRFPQSDMLYAIRGWLLKMRFETPAALNDLNTAISMNPRNAVALYNLGILALEKNDYTNSKRYFEDTIEADKGGTFGDKAGFQLRELDNKMKEFSLSGSSSTQ